MSEYSETLQLIDNGRHNNDTDRRHKSDTNSSSDQSLSVAPESDFNHFFFLA